jgi:hypothetical protein
MGFQTTATKTEVNKNCDWQQHCRGLFKRQSPRHLKQFANNTKREGLSAAAGSWD